MSVSICQSKRAKQITFRTEEQAEIIRTRWENICAKVGYPGKKSQMTGQKNFEIMDEMTKDFYDKIKIRKK